MHKSLVTERVTYENYVGRWWCSKGSCENINGLLECSWIIGEEKLHCVWPNKLISNYAIDGNVIYDKKAEKNLVGSFDDIDTITWSSGVIWIKQGA